MRCDRRFSAHATGRSARSHYLSGYDHDSSRLATMFNHARYLEELHNDSRRLLRASPKPRQRLCGNPTAPQRPCSTIGQNRYLFGGTYHRRHSPYAINKRRSHKRNMRSLFAKHQIPMSLPWINVCALHENTGFCSKQNLWHASRRENESGTRTNRRKRAVAVSRVQLELLKVVFAVGHHYSSREARYGADLPKVIRMKTIKDDRCRICYDTYGHLKQQGLGSVISTDCYRTAKMSSCCSSYYRDHILPTPFGKWPCVHITHT